MIQTITPTPLHHQSDTLINLRPDTPLKGTATPVRPPRTIATLPPQATPIIHTPQIIIAADTAHLYAIATDPQGQTHTNPIADIPARPCTTLTYSTGKYAILMPDATQHLMLTIHSPAEITIEPLMPQIPQIALTAEPLPNISTSFAPTQLTTAYAPTATRLETADTTLLTKAYLNLYTHLADKARSQGAYIQPVMAQWQITAPTGAIIHTSSPVMVMPTTAALQLATLKFTLTDTSSIPPLPCTAVPFRVKINHASHIPPALADARITLLISPQLHPVNPHLPIDARLSRINATQTQLTLTPSGLHPTLTPLHQDSPYRTLAAIIASNPSHFLRPAASFTLTYSNGRTAYTATDSTDTAGELRQLAALTPHPSSTSILQNLRLPHTFTAQTTHHAGPHIIYGNITAHRALPPLPACCAATLTSLSESTPQPQASMVTFADGSSQTTSDTVQISCAATLQPMAAYPAADATTLTLITADAQVTLPLTALPGADYALWFNPQAIPLDLADHTAPFAMPESNPQPLHYPSAVAIASAQAPNSPILAENISTAPLIALSSSPRSRSSWDFAAEHIYAFTADGIYALACKPAKHTLTASLISTHVADSAAAVARSDKGVFALCSGQIIRLNGAAATRCTHITDAKALGWAAPFDELWCLRADGTSTILDPSGRPLFHRTTPRLTAFVPSPPGTLMAIDTQRRLLDLSTEPYTDTPVPIQWHSTLRLPHRRKPTAICWQIFSPALSGTLSLTASDGTPQQTLVVAHTADGPLRSPIHAPLFCQPILDLAIHIEATAHPHTDIRPTSITLSEK